VELSWSIRDVDGCPSACNLRGMDARCQARAGEDFPDLGAMRVCWQAVGDAGIAPADCGRALAGGSSARFRCEQAHGVTGFEIAPGPTAIWIEPLCADNGLVPRADRYEVPAPIVRDITSGDVATLNALLVVVDARACEPR